jgi:hypothetical protein
MKKRKSIAIMLSVLMALTVYAPMSAYAYDSGAPYANVNGEDLYYGLLPDWNSDLSMWPGDDEISEMINLGFDFNYFGTTMSAVSLSSNGFLSFNDLLSYFYMVTEDDPDTEDFDEYDDSGLYNFDDILPENILSADPVEDSDTAYNNIIYAFLDDLTFQFTGEYEDGDTDYPIYIPSVYYKTVGTAPNREFIAQWTNTYFYEGDLQLGDFQIILYETTGEIRLQYRVLNNVDGPDDSSGRSYGASAAAGIESPDGSDREVYLFEGYDGNDDVEMAFSSGLAVSFMPDGMGGYDMTYGSDVTYNAKFLTNTDAPSTPFFDESAGYTTDGAIDVTDPTLAWTSADRAESYRLIVSADEDFGSLDIDQESLSSEDRFATLTGLAGGTTYYWRVEAKNAYGSMVSATYSFSTALGEPVYITYARLNFQDDESLLNMQGDAYLSDGAIILTPAEGDMVGSAFFNNKIAQKDGFSSFFKFYLNDRDDGADGLVFIVSSSANEYGSEGGGMGYEGITSSVGIEFDTYYNEDTEGDAGDSHIAIDLNGENVLDNAPLAYAELDEGYFDDDGPFYTWIDYNGSELEVRISTTRSRPDTATLSQTIDLSDYAGTEYYVGFTAATGGSSEEHRVAEWYFDNKYWTDGLTAQGNYQTDSTPPTAPTMTKSSGGVSLSGSEDTGSGLDRYEYRIAEGEWVSGNSASTSGLAVGTLIYGRAIDRSGNISEVTTYTVVSGGSNFGAPPDPVPATAPESMLEFNIGESDSLLTLGADNEKKLPMDVAPILFEDRTLLPIRFVIEPLGGTIVWNQSEKKVTITRGDTTIELWIGNNMAKINGVPMMIDPDNPKVMPLLINPGRTMLPLRFISEALGCTVTWDALTQKILITDW